MKGSFCFNYFFIPMNDNYFSEKITVEPNHKRQKKSVSISTLIISIITTIVCVFIISSKRENIISLFGFDSQIQEQNNDTQTNIGDEISCTGKMYDDGDILNYTHSLESLEFGKLALKSSKINLNNYKNEVYIEGIVEKIFQGTPVVSVSTIYSLDIEELNENEDENEEKLLEMDYESKFLPNIGIYLDNKFFQKYSLLNEGEAGILKIKKSETNEIININYFICSNSDNNKNCDRFNNMFSTSSTEKFVDTYNINYYKQAESQSRFFSNDSLFGYFINNTDDFLTKDLIKHIQVINKKFIEKNILNKVDLLCQDSEKGIKKIEESSIVLKDKDLLVNLKGSNEEESFECKLKIDPTLKNMAALLELKSLGKLENKNTNEQTDGNKKEVTANYNRDPNIPQFPINLEKSLKFTSRKGFSYTFPSSNIAYAAQNTQEDFGQIGVNCYSVMNVVQYSEKELVTQKGEVKIYECNIKGDFEESEKLIHKKEGEKDFIIEIVNPARIAFANNITISIE
ncbi:MAG TPA: hypothetical protein PKX34_00065 [Candidatus Absconditabacterales bacterium]|nr:hypothetical protein [Candidatus Absconditabacterales bacterium]